MRYPNLLKTTFAVGAFCALCTASAQVPQLLSYQGRVQVGTNNFDGAGQFKFALVNSNANVSLWSNSGESVAGSQPTAAVSLPVSKGLYSVLLGDTALMKPLPSSVFTNADLRLRVWFSDGPGGFAQLSPDVRITPVAYAFRAVVADTVTQLPANVARLDQPQSFTDLALFTDQVGIGTSKPQDRLAVSDGVVIDQADRNDGTLQNALRFGDQSGEGIGSKRTGKGNQYGLDFYTAFTPRMTIANNGNVGIGTGTAQPRTKVDVRGEDPAIELRNTNDQGRGGVIQNTFASVQMGMFAEGNGTGQVPAAGKRAFFGYNTDGQVGSLTNSMTSPSAPGFRNVLDDGQGNARIAGNLTAKNMPFVVYQHESTERFRGGFGPMPKCSEFDIYEVVVQAPGPGVITVNGYVTLGGVGRAGGQQCDDPNQNFLASFIGDFLDAQTRDAQTAGRFSLQLDKVTETASTKVSQNSRELTHPDTFGGERWDVSYVQPVTSAGKFRFKMHCSNYTSLGMNEKSLVAMFFPMQ